MDWSSVLIFSLGGLLTLMIVGVPIYACFLLTNLVAMLLLLGSGSGTLFVNSLINTAMSTTLAPIPLFILMGELLFRSGSVDVLFDSVDEIIGRIRGRLYVVVISLTTIFGALSGSAIAVAAMLGRSVYPGMQERGYDRQVSATVIMIGACLAPIIPPSLLAVIIGSLADVSIASLLLAGIVPGLVIAAITLGYIYLFADLSSETNSKTKLDDPGEPLATRRRIFALIRMMPFTLVIFSVMGLVLLGVATPSEAAGTGFTGAVIVAAIYRKLSVGMILESLESTAKVSAMILLIVSSSVLFSQLLAVSGASEYLIDWVTDLDLSKWTLLFVLMLLPLLLCMFIDQIGFMLIAIPLYIPIIQSLGVDPVWFWTLFAINLTIGTITPPFGYTLFALRAAGPPEMTTKLVFRASRPAVIILLLCLLLFAAVPELVTFLPRLVN